MVDNNGFILIVDDMEDIREILILMIESVFDYQIIEAQSGDEATKILKENDQIKVVISDYDMPEGNGSELYNYIKINRPIPFLLVSSIEIEDDQNLNTLFQDNPFNSRIKKPFDHNELIETLTKVLESTNDPKYQNEDSNRHSIYQRIKITRALQFENAFSDIYIKVTDSKHIKICNTGDSINKEQLRNYSDKNVKYLYLDKKQYKDFLNDSILNLSNKLEKASLQGQEIIGLQLHSIEEVRELVLSIGIQKNIIELTDKVSETVNKKLKKEKNLQSFLGDMLNRNNFFFEQSNITNYLTSAMIKDLGWDIQRTTAKMVQASIFCDIALNDEKLSIITSVESAQHNKLPLQGRQQIENHMKSAIEILSKAKNDFLEEEKIIANHHERPDGSGFPKKLTATQIPAMSALFNIAHDYSRLLILNGQKNNLDPVLILEQLDPAYQTGNYSKPYEALKKCLTK